MDIYARFIPKYTKKEAILLQLIVLNFSNYKPLVFNIKELTILKGKEDTESILKKFIKKSLKYSLRDERGIIQPFRSYSIIGKNIEFFLSKDFQEALAEKNKFKIFSLKELIFFSNEFTKDFFYMFILSKKNTSFYITLDEFRTTFELKEYERFYDFERNILKVLTKDINQNTNYFITYEKIKKTNFKNSKVTGINFIIKDKDEDKKIDNVNKLISIASSKIKDYKGVFELIYENLKIYHPTELELFIHKATKEMKKEKKSFKDTLEDIIYKKNQFKLLKEFSGKFATPIKLENQLSSILKELKIDNFLEKEIDSTKFLMKLYAVRNNKELTFEKNGILISINYNPRNLSYIKIFKNN